MCWPQCVGALARLAHHSAPTPFHNPSCRHIPALQRLSRPFQPGQDRLEGLATKDSNASGCPVLADAAAHLDCEVISRMDAADHWVVYAKVRRGEGRACTGGPAMQQGRGWGRLAASRAAPLGRRSHTCIHDTPPSAPSSWQVLDGAVDDDTVLTAVHHRKAATHY